MSTKKSNIFSLVVLCPTVVLAGDLEPSAGPNGAESAMYSIGDICNRLENGADGSKTTFTEPTTGPTSGTGCTLNEVMNKAPAKENASGAQPGEVRAGKKYWGLVDDHWGVQTGTLATQTLSPDNQKVEAGYYADTTLGSVDTDLKPENIKKGVQIFGVLGTASGDSEASYPAPVAKTGELESSANFGVAWPNPRFTDNSNGTVTDNLTGLIWLKDANCFERETWSNAKGSANELKDGQCGLTDGSKIGDWHLPTVSELQSLIHYGFTNPALPNTAGTDQWQEGEPFTDVQEQYWSITSYSANKDSAFYVYFSSGDIDTYSKSSSYYKYVLPVRGGQK